MRITTNLVCRATFSSLGALMVRMPGALLVATALFTSTTGYAQGLLRSHEN